LRYCLPNKLFQSLVGGAICIISHNLKEIMLSYKNIAPIIEYESFIDGASVQCEINNQMNIADLLENNVKNYKSFLGIN
jgi:hypothetical protein